MLYGGAEQGTGKAFIFLGGYGYYEKNIIALRCVALLLTAALVFGISPLGALTEPNLGFTASAAALTEGNFYYEVTKDGGATITGCVQTPARIIFPSKLGGYPVTDIASWSFSGNLDVMSIEIPACITRIGTYAFYNCHNLEKVTFAKGSRLTSLEPGAFYATSIKKIHIPAGVTSIPEELFLRCSKLESVTFATGSRLKSVGSQAFLYCDLLSGISLPPGVKSIASQAFAGCKLLKFVHIPSGVTVIEGSAASHFSNAYICSDTEDCRAKAYAAQNGITFKACGAYAGHCPDCHEPYTVVSNNNGTHTKTCAKSHTVVESCVADPEKSLVVAPGCLTSGYTSLTCACCDFGFNGFYTEATGHTYGNWVSSDNGLHTRTCSVCTDDTADHCETASCTVVTDEALAPTCAATGLTEGSHCPDCNRIFKAQTVVPALDHKYGHWASNGNGTHTRTCSVCTGGTAGRSETVSCTVVTDDALAPTCAATGLTEGSHCSVCGEVFTAQTVRAALGHKYGAWVQGNGVTHTRTCSVCTEDAAGHCQTVNCTAVTDMAVAASCTSDGLTVGSHCPDCNRIFKAQTVVPAPGHKYGAWTSSGGVTHTRTCSVCTDGTAGHCQTASCTVVADAALTPTCTTTGLTEGSHCSVCGEVFTAQAVRAALGHKYGAWVSTGNSMHMRTCCVCAEDAAGHTELTAHTPGAWIVDVPARLGTAGLRHNECTACGELLQTEEIPALTPAVSLTAARGTVKFGETLKIDAEYLALSGYSLKWESSDPAVARVDQSGNITGTGRGVATITATLVDASASPVRDSSGNALSDEIKITATMTFWQIIIELFRNLLLNKST